MSNESEAVKVVSESPEAAVPEILESAPKSSPGVEPSVIDERDNARKAIEDKIFESNSASKPEVIEGSGEEVKKEEKKDADPEEVKKDVQEPTPIDDSLKAKIKKRIDKEVAKRKTAEEELAELRSENERLKSGKADSQSEPTIEQCEAYILKCREEGDYKNEIAAMRYLIKLEKDAALKAVDQKNRETVEANQRDLSNWVALQRDYESDNPDLSLSNQSGLLYKEAMKLYQDPELREVYSDPDKIMGFRKATHDAYRHIVENGLHKKNGKNAPSEVIDTTPKPVRKPILAEPSSDSSEETSQESSKQLTDAEKVKEEILQRRKNLYRR